MFSSNFLPAGSSSTSPRSIPDIEKMLALLLISSLMLWPKYAFPAPLPTSQNATLETTGWRSEPTTRGTFRLIFSCITTLTACVYTAVHLNVPQEGTSTVARFRRKAGWVALGVLAPEFVVYTAWAQWHAAGKLQYDINNIINNKKEMNPAANSDTKQELWTLTHAFYAGMGGFAIKIEPVDGQEYIADSPRLTVTAQGIRFLASNGIIPEMPKSSIEDKSKASTFAKLFACTQGGWLIIQSIARLHEKLPITLLEINTVGHVFCALAIYVFWLQKPLDIEEPTAIDKQTWPNLPSLCALMWMNSSVSERAIKRHPKACQSGTELESLLFSKPVADHQANEQHVDISGLDVTIVSPSDGDTEIILSKKQFLYNTGFALDPKSRRFAKVVFTKKEQRRARWDRQNVLGGIPEEIELNSTDIKRWHMASQVLITTPSLLNNTNFKEVESKTEGSFEGWKFQELLSSRTPDWPGNVLERRAVTLFGMQQHFTLNWFSLFLALATALYGGLHAAAWNAYFPTESERHWWRFSSVTVGASGSGFVALTSLSYFFIFLLDQKSSWWLILTMMDAYVIGFAGLGLIVAFAISRTFLVVEALISFRRLPVAVYSSPAWLQYLVHV